MSQLSIAIIGLISMLFFVLILPSIALATCKSAKKRSLLFRFIRSVILLVTWPLMPLLLTIGHRKICLFLGFVISFFGMVWSGFEFYNLYTDEIKQVLQSYASIISLF